MSKSLTSGVTLKWVNSKSLYYPNISDETDTSDVLNVNQLIATSSIISQDNMETIRLTVSQQLKVHNIDINGKIINESIEIIRDQAQTGQITIDPLDYITNTFISNHDGGVLITIPIPSDILGITYYFKNINLTPITIKRIDDGIIETETTITLQQYEYISLLSDGTIWIIVNRS